MAIAYSTVSSRHLMYAHSQARWPILEVQLGGGGHQPLVGSLNICTGPFPGWPADGLRKQAGTHAYAYPGASPRGGTQICICTGACLFSKPIGRPTRDRPGAYIYAAHLADSHANGGLCMTSPTRQARRAWRCSHISFVTSSPGGGPGGVKLWRTIPATSPWVGGF
jgi:hypothetical protein